MNDCSLAPSPVLSSEQSVQFSTETTRRDQAEMKMACFDARPLHTQSPGTEPGSGSLEGPDARHGQFMRTSGVLARDVGGQSMPGPTQICGTADRGSAGRRSRNAAGRTGQGAWVSPAPARNRAGQRPTSAPGTEQTNKGFCA
jgi:hypothetical protein